MAFSRAVVVLLLASLVVSATVPASMADDNSDPALIHVNYERYNREPVKPYPPCTECYGNCTKVWQPHTCHFKCFWCLPLNQTISGEPPSTGMQSFIQGTRSSVGFVVDTLATGVNGIKSLVHTVF